MSKFHRAFKYLAYWLNAVNEHSLQGPFVYELYSKIIKKDVLNNEFTDIEQARERLKKSKHIITIDDKGAGSSYLSGSKRKVADIAKYGITSPKHARLLARLIEFLGAKNILEFGTSLGINTLYLSANNGTQVTTIEASRNLINIAESVFEGFDRKNIQPIEGDIDKVLHHYLMDKETIDFVYFDANHTEKATLNYFKQCLVKVNDSSCFVFDDIHWSKEMDRAWKKIHSHYNVTLSIDLYQMGIVFFNPEMKKQHYALEF